MADLCGHILIRRLSAAVISCHIGLDFFHTLCLVSGINFKAFGLSFSQLLVPLVGLGVVNKSTDFEMKYKRGGGGG